MSKVKTTRDAKRSVSKGLNLSVLQSILQAIFSLAIAMVERSISAEGQARLAACAVSSNIAALPTKAITVNGKKYKRQNRAWCGVAFLSNGQVAVLMEWIGLSSFRSAWDVAISAMLRALATEYDSKSGQYRHNEKNEDVQIAAAIVGFEFKKVTIGLRKEWQPLGAKGRELRNNQFKRHATLPKGMAYPTLPELVAVRGVRDRLEKDAPMSGSNRQTIYCVDSDCPVCPELVAEKGPQAGGKVMMHVGAIEGKEDCLLISKLVQGVTIKRKGNKILSAAITFVKGLKASLTPPKVTAKQRATAQANTKANRAQHTLDALLDKLATGTITPAQQKKLAKAMRASKK